MWKSVLGRMVQSRSLVTTSHNFVNSKGPLFSDSEYVKEKPRYEKKEVDFSEKKNYRKYDRNSGDRAHRHPFDREKRDVSFDPTDGGPDYPGKSFDRYSNKREESFSYPRRGRSEEHGENDRYSYKKQEGSFNNQRRGWNDEPREDDRRNANLSPIGTPGKWKVGAGFVKEADRLRNEVKTQHDFVKKLKNQNKKKDPGIRRQMKVIQEFTDPNKYPREEELDEEVDAMNFDKLYDKSQKTRAEVREMVQLKMVKQKYFKESKEAPTLSWSDKEHIRYLHNTDPQQWTFEMIAEQFRIDPEVAKAVATAKWIPKKPKSTEGIPLNSEEIYPLATITTEEQQINEPPAKSTFKGSNKPMTWRELRTSMGESEDIVNSATKSEPARVEPEELVDKDTIFQYLSRGSPVKWANSVKSTDPQNKEDVNVYFHNSKIENQTPFGKDGEGDAVAIDKRGDVYQKGDSFYNADGELLYRVPGLTK